MISEARHEAALTNEDTLNRSCRLINRFVGGTLRGDDYLQLLFHLDRCPRCYERVRSFSPQKRRELYALQRGLEEVVFEEPDVHQDVDFEEEEVTMPVTENRPGLSGVPEGPVSPSPSGQFDDVAKLLEQEIRVTDVEIEKVRAKMSALEGRRAELQGNLEHLAAAVRILARFKGSSASRVMTHVPFVRSNMNFGVVTQREAILQVLGRKPAEALNKKQLTQALMDGGFPFRSVERTERQNTVYQTCRRMVEANELLMTIQGRDAFYQLVQSNRSRAERTSIASAAG